MSQVAEFVDYDVFDEGRFQHGQPPVKAQHPLAGTTAPPAALVADLQRRGGAIAQYRQPAGEVFLDLLPGPIPRTTPPGSRPPAGAGFVRQGRSALLPSTGAGPVEPQGLQRMWKPPPGPTGSGRDPGRGSFSPDRNAGTSGLAGATSSLDRIHRAFWRTISSA